MARKAKTSVETSSAKDTATVKKTVTEEKKTVEKKDVAAPKATDAKKTTKASTTKTAAAKTTGSVKTSIRVQYQGKDVSTDDFIKEAKSAWSKETGKKAADLKSLDLYVKPEENMVYYVVNGNELGSFPL